VKTAEPGGANVALFYFHKD